MEYAVQTASIDTDNNTDSQSFLTDIEVDRILLFNASLPSSTDYPQPEVLQSIHFFKPYWFGLSLSEARNGYVTQSSRS